MLEVQVELDSRRIGGSSLLIPFKDIWLASHTLRDFFPQALAQHLGGSTENVTLFRSKR